MHDLLLAFFSALLGAGLSIGTALYLLKAQRDHRRRSIATALAAEILSLVVLVRAERYEEDLRASVQQLEAPDFNGTFERFVVHGTGNYFAIFEASLSELGDMEPGQIADIVGFFKLAQALLDGLRADVGGQIFKEFGREPTVAHYRQVADNLARLCSVGHRLATDLAGKAMVGHIDTTANSLLGPRGKEQSQA